MTLLEEPAYTTIIVHSPFEALKIAPALKPDLLIIDYLLSGMTGIELYDQLHAQATLQDTPAIITSASLYVYLQQLEERDLTGLEKPFDLDVLLETVKQVLNR